MERAKERRPPGHFEGVHAPAGNLDPLKSLRHFTSAFFTGTSGFILVLAVLLASSVSSADEIDDLLVKRQNNFAKVKKYRAEYTVETENTGGARKLGSGLMKYTYTMTRRNRNHPDPVRRYDLDMEVTEPAKMHFKIEDGQFSYLTSRGEWIKRGLPPSATAFLYGLPEMDSADVAGNRRNFDIKMRKDKDSLFGGRKGVEFVPKGRAKMYARKVETVDSQTGVATEIELYDGNDRQYNHIKVSRLGKHNGVAIVEEMESVTFSLSGMGDVVRRTKVSNIQVETE